MPKKFAGENSKAVQAKSRKAEVRNSENEKKDKAAEDALWEETDKLVLRKQDKKEAELKKQQEKLQKKLESDKLLEEETKNLKSAKPQRVEKITKYQIDNKKLETKEATNPKKDQKVDDIVENTNRLSIDGKNAQDIDEAIAILSNETSDGPDKHPEKRMKAAYKEFYDTNLERFKEDNPNARLSQLKQMIFKEWQKSPSNPMNQ